MVRPMVPTLIFPDVEVLLCNVIRPALQARTEPYAADVYVSNRPPTPDPAGMPTTYPPRMVTFRSDGGPRSGPLLRQRVGVNVWHEDDASAMALAHLVLGLMSGIDPAVHPVRGFSGSAPVRVADDASRSHVYFTAVLPLTGTPL